MRYQRLLLFLLTALAVTGTARAGVKMTEYNEQGLVLELSCPQLQFDMAPIKGREYYRVSAAGCPSLTDPGRPALPVIGAMIIVPPNTIPEIISTEAGEAVSFKKLPAPAPEILMDKETIPDPAVYRGRQPFPARMVSLSKPARAGTQKFAFVSFTPVQFHPAGGSLTFVKSIRIGIRFRPASLGDQPLASIKSGQPLTGIGGIAAKSAINHSQAAGWSSRPAADGKAKTADWGDTLLYKILIEDEGIYQIGYNDLLLAGIRPGDYDPRSYKIFNQGREIPVYFKGQADGVFDQDDYFEFYGQRLKGDSSYYHPYSRDNVYWLALGGSFGARMIEEDGSPVNPGYILPGSYRYTIHQEKDSLFCRLSSELSDQTDRWFWRRIDERDSMVLNFPLPGLDAGAADSAALTISLHGYTAIGLPTNDHWAIISLNGRSLENSLRWDGQTPYPFKIKLSPANLSAVNNRLVLKHGPLDTIDSYFMNWMEVEYSRNYTADGGVIAFNTPAPWSDSLLRYEVDGFENQGIDLYKLGVSKITGTKVERNADGVTYRLTFDDRTSSQTSYYAVQNDQQHKLKPKAIVANHIPDQPLVDPSQGAEYLIITTEEFISPAQKLAAIRGNQFKGAKVVLASDIYDAFNYGIPQDRPIKEYLRQAFMTWQVPPAYVLLLGGGSWDPRNLTGHSSTDKIPVHLTRTSDYGPTADDNYYANILEDDQYSLLPDITVGRIPVYSANDCQTWEAKRSSYEQQPLLDQWQRDFLLIAGRNQNLGDNFKVESDLLAATLDPRYTVSKVYHSAPATTQDLIDQFHEGSVLAGFYGHGSGQVWSHDSFFRIDEVARLDNWGRWPLVGAFTCYSGAFDIPDTISISQALLLKTNSGAIGVYASSGPSWEGVLEQVFFGAVDDHELTRFGDIMVSSKFDLAARKGTVWGQVGEMITSYNLLGDPGMRLAVSHRGLALTVAPAALLPGDSATATVRGGFKAGSITLLSLCDSAGSVSASYSVFSDSAGKAEVRVLVPSTMPPGRAIMKAFVKDADSSWAVSGEFGVSRPVFYGITASPSLPVNLVDSVEIVSGAASLWGIDSVWCEWNTSEFRSDTALFSRTIMDSTAPGYYRTREKIINTGLSDTVLNYRICLSGPGFVKETGSFRHHHLLTRSDLTPRNKVSGTENVYLGGKRRLTLFADVFNYGEIRADSIPVFFYRYNGGLPVTDSAGTVLDSILAGGMATPSVPWPLTAEDDRVNVIIDPANSQWPPDQDTSNNHLVSGERVIPPDGRVYTQMGAGGSGDTVSLSKYPVSFYLPDSSLNDSAVAVAGFETINLASALNPVRQPGLNLIGDVNSGLDAYFVALTDSSRALLNGKKLWISLNWPQLAAVSDLSLVNLYRYNYRQGLWQKVPGGADSSRAWGQCDSLGLFIPMIGSDSTAPVITARVDRQATGWGQTVKVSRPQYSVLIEDQNGINLDSVWVKKDGVLVPRSDYNLPETPQDHTSVPLAYAPYLADGRHNLEFGACDNLGNGSSLLVQLTVSAEFGLDELACYPTPVDGDYATFYFFVGDHADGYQLKIYTVAGRLVKSFKGGYVSGMKTLRWDADDGAGQKVANGVYFYTLEVWSGGKQQKKTEKLAVLR